MASSADTVRLMPALKGRRTTLLVGNLPAGTRDELEADLRAAFGAFGDILECEVINDEEGRSRGFAFVRLGDGRQTEQAKRELDGKQLRGDRRHASAADEQPLRVRWALDTHTLCVSDLGPLVSAQHLQEAFEQFGNIVSCRIEYEPPEFNSHSKRFGFVEFSKRSNAIKVQQLLSDNLFLLHNSPRPVRVEFAVDDAADDAEGEPVDAALKTKVPPPHFAVPGSLEFDFALKWRELALAHSAEVARLAEVHRQEREILRLEQSDAYKQSHDKFKTLDDPKSAVASGRYGDEAGGAASGARADVSGQKRARQ